VAPKVGGSSPLYHPLLLLDRSKFSFRPSVVGTPNRASYAFDSVLHDQSDADEGLRPSLLLELSQRLGLAPFFGDFTNAHMSSLREAGVHFPMGSLWARMCCMCQNGSSGVRRPSRGSLPAMWELGDLCDNCAGTCIRPNEDWPYALKGCVGTIHHWLLRLRLCVLQVQPRGCNCFA
jgi:hypothetical protein